MTEDNPQKALYYCKKGLQANEDCVQLWKKNGQIQFILGHYAEADYAFENAIALGNYELETWTQWIDALLHLREWEKALKIGLQACEFYPEKGAIAIRVAGCYHALGKTDESNYFKRTFQNNQGLIDEMTPFFPDLIVEKN